MTDEWQHHGDSSSAYGGHASDSDHELSTSFESNNVVRRLATDGIDEISAYHWNKHNHNTNLHHRNIVQQNEGRPTSPSQRHQRRPANNRRLQFHSHNISNGHSKHKRKWRKMIQIAVFSFVIGYLVLLFLSHSLMKDYTQLEDAFFQPLSTSRASFLEPHGRLYAIRERMEQRKLEERNKIKRINLNRSQQRALRTKPPKMDAIDSEDLYAYYDFSFIDEEPRVSSSDSFDTSTIKPAKLKDLCGSQAHKSATNNPNNFQARDVLNSKARVLITGVLNPIGFQLALTLKERCGVEVMAGIDPAFPNTVEHRIELQKRIQLLTTTIPKFIQAVSLPLVGLDPRPSKSKKEPVKTISTTGESDLLNMRPTHIIHLASFSTTEYRDFEREKDQDLRNLQSPYVRHGQTADMFSIRSSHVAMEQTLASILDSGNRPHLVYASTAEMRRDGKEEDLNLRSNKVVDEILADVYNTLHGIYSVGVRLPNGVYGPWGRRKTPIHDLSEAAIEQYQTQNNTRIHIDSSDNYPRDFVYVDDIVEGIIAAMQYRETDNKATVFDFSSNKETRLTEIYDFLSLSLRTGKSESNPSIKQLNTSTKEATSLSLRTRDILQWSPETSLSIGFTKTVAWYLDNTFPYGERNKAGALITGDEYRNKAGLNTCASNATLCHLGRKYTPCVSECSIKEHCVPTIFDGVVELVKEATEGCDIVLYTQSVGYDVQDLKLHSVYKEEGESFICNFAFVPESSRLVRAAVDKVPESGLKSFGITPTKEDLRDPALFEKRKIEKLNGRLLYKGWILIWIKNAEDPLPTIDRSLLKMSPGKFFHSDVKHAVYVDENFPISPNPDDVLFLVGQTHRPALSERNAYRKLESGKRKKYRLVAEPERRAVILLSPLKHKKVTETGEPAKISVLEATKYMQVEVGDNPEEKEPSSLKRQREFYERVPTFVNRLDFRSNSEPWYKYELKNWVRTRWIVHDMHLEEGRQLRCDWYQEHIQWDNNLDQLSFAHVMTLHEIKRRISFEEPDDHIKPDHVTHPELKQLSDAHEWYALDSENNRDVYTNIPMQKFSIFADHMLDKDEHDKEPDDALVHNVKLAISHKSAVPLFVRVVSERVMMKARQTWADEHSKKEKK